MYDKYLNREKSGNMAKYGQPNVPEDDQDNQDRSRRNSQSSELTLRGENTTVNSCEWKI